MEFAGINYLAVPLAAFASFMFGGIWYGALAKPWMAAAGLSAEKIKESNKGRVMPWSFVVAVFAQLVMAYVLAGLVGHFGTNEVTIKNGLISGVFVWVGFVVTALTTNYAFQERPLALTLIDGAHWLGVLLIQGAVIGWIGVPATQ